MLTRRLTVPVDSDPKIVCLLDVLGFENILDRLGLAGLRANYETLIAFVKEQTGGIDIAPTPEGHVAVGWLALGNACFSDSLLFWTPCSDMSLRAFTLLIAEAICFGFGCGLPFRGAIAVGEATLHTGSGVFLGEPLVEVVRTERIQQWIGVSFGPSFRNSKAGFHLNTVLPYKSHYKDPTDCYATGMTDDWPRLWRESRNSNPRPVLQALNLNPAFGAYYEKSLSFVDFSERNHDWFTRQRHLDYG
jgi:hypothetical protein